MPASLWARGWPRRLTPTERSPRDELAPGTVSLAVLPDTQYYTSCRSPHLRAQADWVARHAKRRNIAAVLQLGDLTEHNTAAQWEFLRDALKPVTDTLPAFLATGNHDHGDGGQANRRWTLFREYFSPPSAATAELTSATFEPGDWENAYYRLTLPRVVLGVLVLGWSPHKGTVQWAASVLQKHPKDRVIFVTHAYLYHDSTRYDWAAKGDGQEWNPNAYGTAAPRASSAGDAARAASDDAYDGERLWQELISQHPGIFLTLSGHVLGDGTGLASSSGKSGNVVHQVLSNYQMLEQGGSGYLRLVELLPSGDTLRIKTYSPSLDLWATAEDQRFDLALSPPLWR